jgi:ribosomal protein S8
MKDKLLNILKKVINWLESLHFKYSLTVLEDVAYSSLSPIDNGDEDGHYSRALLWALKNRKKEDIRNIALTGSYGSGKSSILKTFQKKYKGNDLKFLNISLATFKDEKPELDENGKEIKVDKADLLRLIETSILEQIFYHEVDKNIPDSRFKKIKSYSSLNLFLFSLGYLVFLIAIYNYFNPYFIQSIFKDVAINNTIYNAIHYGEIIIIALGIFFVILKSARIISAITITKLKIQNAEIGLGDNSNKSILNHHIDEILYFFSVTPYNVIIIEDLDRFQETEIFTKLREVNLLLNNSEKTKRKEIAFIYAVRDDMFTDKERTKFFDFIIPVIPVINSSNSSEILFKKKNQFQYNLSDSLIEDISFFIDDMRLLHNISNEFYLYKEKLSKNLNQDKLFAIITYKNIYPNDFMKLSYNEGDLYHIFSSKTSYIKTKISEIENKIETSKEQILEFENVYFDNTKDLRLLYVARIIEKLPGFKSFIVNQSVVSIDGIIKDENFEYLKTDNFSYNQMVYNSYYGREDIQVKQPNFKFTVIEKLVSPAKTYLGREKEIIEIKNGKINAIKNKVQELEKQKQPLRHFKICELLISNQSSGIVISDNLNKNFVNILLRNGYIAEDYIDYISLFHEESIARADYQFHINIKNQIKQPFDYKLSKIEKLISKINSLDFQTEFILNYDILDYLLSNSDKYLSQIESIFNKLRDESKISIEFIIGYYETSQNLEDFIKILCNKWNNIWGFIDSDPDFSDDLKKDIFKSIIEHGDIKAILDITKLSSFKKIILSDPLFLNITDNHDKLKKVIRELKIVFSKIDFENSNDEMLSFIYENNHYQLNREIVVFLIKKFGEFNRVEFDNSNFFAIKSSKTDKLIQYIEENIDDYIENVYLKITTNINEKEEYIIKLLNNENIEIGNKESIISQVETKITKLSSIDNPELYPMLLENNKMIATWGNLLHDYDSQNIEEDEEDEKKVEKEISESSIGFINTLENAEVLSKVKVPKEVNSLNIYGDFWKKLIQINETDEQPYDLIIKSSPWCYGDLNFKDLSENKIKSLINNNCVNPIAKSYASLKENTDGLNIDLLERRKIDYFKILDQLTFDSEDMELVLKSTVLNNSEKLKILNTCSEETITTNNNLKLLSSILLTDNSFVVSDNVLNSLLINNNVPAIERIKLFMKNSYKYDLLFIDSFLKSLGGDYSWITITTSKAKIPKTQDNRQLLDILVSKGYISTFSDRDSDFRINHKRK